MVRKITQDEFLARCHKVHGDKYDYSHAHYVRGTQKVPILCPKHGTFEQRPNDHTNLGQLCPKCSAKAKITQADFIARCRKVHRHKFDYSKTVYVGGVHKVTVTCREHGDFRQKAASHLAGVGCFACAGKTKLTAANFFARARHAHGDKYDYAKTVYVTTGKKIDIGCRTHGTFRQTPGNHMAGSGCPKCSPTHNVTQDQFLARCRKTHGDKYDYAKTVYVNTETKVTITCPEHGDFDQLPQNHAAKTGCPPCGLLARTRNNKLKRLAKTVDADRKIQ